jgi:DNA-binding SARP family transcriptional activator
MPGRLLEFRLLGRFEYAGLSQKALPKKTQALLAYLATHCGRPVGRDQLADLLWGENGTEQARHSLRQSLAALRRTLGDERRYLLAADSADLLLRDCEEVDVDLQRFERLAQSTDCADLTAAGELYRGPFLANFDVGSEPFVAWVMVERTRLEEVAGGMLQRLASALSGRGEHDAAIAAARRLVSLDPLREDGHRLLMRLYAAAGRRAEAIRQFELCRGTLREELGIAPDEQTGGLARALQAEVSIAGEVRKDAAPANEAAAAVQPIAPHEEADLDPAPAVEAPARRATGSDGRERKTLEAAHVHADAFIAKSVESPRRPRTRTLRAFALSLLALVCATAAVAEIWRYRHFRFDGNWSVQLVCSGADTALGYTYRFPAQVSDGILRGERGTAGTPGWLMIEGPIQSDGHAILNARGLTNDPERTPTRVAPGTPYSYTIDAHFGEDQGSGKRLELRPCAFDFYRVRSGFPEKLSD